MTRDPADKKFNLPPWLRDQPLPPRPSDERDTPAAGAQPLWAAHASSADDANEDVPDWLRASTNEYTSTNSETLPDWLRESAATSTPANEKPLPDWLGESATNTPANEETLPDWLREPASSGTAPGNGDQPDWLRETAPSGETYQPAESSAEEVPDWLRSLATESETSAPEPTAPTASNEAVPDWLLAMAEESSQPAPNNAPDWLNEQAPSSETPDIFASDTTSTSATFDQEATTFEQSTSNQDIQDWLSDIPADRVQAAMDEEEAPPGAMPFSLDGFNTPTTSSPDKPQGPPAWLGEDSPETTSNWFDAPEPVPAAPTSNELSDQDAPSWLQNIAPELPAEERDGVGEQTWATSDSSDTPLWLQEASSSEQPEREAELFQPPVVGETSDGDVPAWLREPTAAPTEDAPLWLSDTQTSDQEQSTAPDWLHAAEPATEPSAAAGADVPDWLRETADGAPPAEDSSLPTWLRDEQKTFVSAAPVAPTSEELPPWLRDDGGVPVPIVEQPGDQALPPWLKGATANEPTTPVLPETPQPNTEPAPIGNWFEEATGGEPKVEEPAQSEFFGGTDLPVWLRPQEQPAAPANAADSRALDWLNRIGGTEDEVPVPVIATARFAPPPSPIKTEEQNRAIALLSQLAESPAIARPEPAVEPTPSVWRRVGAERLLYLLLLLALLLGPFLPALTAPLQVPPANPTAQALFNQISALGPNDVVLIGYDWDARRVAELRPLETAVIDQLVAQRVKLVLMSTDPQGSLLLYDLREKLNAAGYQPRGEDYILLGYQPGGELALRALAQDFGQLLRSDFQNVDMSTRPLATGQSTGTNTPLASLSNFSMIMLLADDQTDVQSWMEQINRAVPDVPFSILLTAEAAPAAEPYLVQPNVFSLTGTTGALAYTTLRGGDTSTIAAQSGMLRLGMATFVVLLLLGAIVAAIANAARRRTA